MRIINEDSECFILFKEYGIRGKKILNYKFGTKKIFFI
jgi:hypothetical protein